VVYALVEAEKSALLRSDDGGESWRAVNTDVDVTDRPFYYNRIAVDPTNENRVYRVHLPLHERGRGPHLPRHRALVQRSRGPPRPLDPPDGHTLISGNDGGVYVSHNRGGSWRFVENLVLAQFYHIAVDDAMPFNVYGGLQDNGSWMGPSQVWETPSFKGSAIVANHWHEIGFGDGFAALPTPRTRDGLQHVPGREPAALRPPHQRGRVVRPPKPEPDTELRFNWNAGIALDPFDPRIVYYGSQFLHRSPDRGETWEIISPDLTTNDPEKQRQAESGGLTFDVTSAENHTTILTIAPVPGGAGGDLGGDRRRQRSAHPGRRRSWTNVADRIPGSPPARGFPTSRHRSTPPERPTWCSGITSGATGPPTCSGPRITAAPGGPGAGADWTGTSTSSRRTRWSPTSSSWGRSSACTCPWMEAQ
jgi:hypothetical protein